MALQIEKYGFPLDLSLSPREAVILYDIMVKARTDWPRANVSTCYLHIYVDLQIYRAVVTYIKKKILFYLFENTVVVTISPLIFDVKELDPEQFFKDKMVITKADARTYEKQLKEELEMWIKHGFSKEVFIISISLPGHHPSFYFLKALDIL